MEETQGKTITEALAEIKTLGIRITKKREFVRLNCARQNLLRDPLESDGGSKVVLAQELQAIRDLEERVILLRRAISRANDRIEVTIQRTTRTLAEWLAWRRDVVPQRRQFAGALRIQLSEIRRLASARQVRVPNMDATVTDAADVSVFVDELALDREAEMLEAIMGELDGILSLKNATIRLEV